MLLQRRPWREELAIIDRTMKAISGVTDPEELIQIYWDGIGELIGMGDYVAVSRRNVEPPFYLITRSSRFTETYNPWTQRDRLPKLTGGLLGEIVYSNDGPVIIDDLPARLAPDDPAYFYLEGFQRAVALPQYDGGEALNHTMMLIPQDTQIDETMIPMMHWQSGLFGRGTQNLVLRNELTRALGRLDRELQSVGAIQRSLLPSELPAIEGFELSAYYNQRRAGGDYYDFFPLAGGAWGLFIADVSGHGTPAAVVMAITHAIAHAQPGTHAPPAALLQYLNDQLARAYTRDGTFVTAFYAVLDPTDRSLTYSLAGHNPPRLVRGDHVISLDRNGGLPLGILEGQTYGQYKVPLERGDLLLLYTDGITEAMAPTVKGAMRRDLFGVDRLDALLLDCAGGASAAECIERVKVEVSRFSANAAPIDDQTLIAIRCAWQIAAAVF